MFQVEERRSHLRFILDGSLSRKQSNRRIGEDYGSATNFCMRNGKASAFLDFKSYLCSFRLRLSEIHAPLLRVENDLNPVDTTEGYYSKKRIPSYTDRVLIKSLPGFEANRKAHKYEACHGVTSSDHAPVCATFSLNLLLGTSNHEDANDDVLPVQNGEEYFAIVTVEKLQLETHDDRLIFATAEEQTASLLKNTSGKASHERSRGG